MSKNDPFLTTPRIREKIQQQLGLNISTSTIKRDYKNITCLGALPGVNKKKSNKTS